MIRIGDPENLCRLYKDLISKDWFMTLLDLKEYIAVKENVMACLLYTSDAADE